MTRKPSQQNPIQKPAQQRLIQQPPKGTQLPPKGTQPPPKVTQQPVRATQPVMYPSKSANPNLGVRSFAAPMGATENVMSAPIPSVNKNQQPEKLVSTESIQSFHRQMSPTYVHVRETTLHREQSPPSIHVDSEVRSNSNREESEESTSECEEKLNEGGGKDMSVKKSKPRRRSIVPNWPKLVKFDKKEEVSAIADADGKRHLCRHRTQNGRHNFGVYCQKLSQLGKDAQALQAHFHNSGATSFANQRADLKEKEGDFSELTFYKSVYAKEDGSFKEDTLSHQFMEDANDTTQENLASSFSSMFRVEIENEVFKELMYKGEVPKRPLNYGFGVKQSDIFGVEGLLRKEGSSYVNDNAMEMENLKVELSVVKKRNEETTQSFKMIVAYLGQVLKEVRKGNVSSDLLDGADSAIHMIIDDSSGSGTK